MTRISQLLVLLAVFASAPAFAQSIWMPRDKEWGLLLELLHPSIEGIDSEFPTGALYLGARIGVGEKLALVAEVPYAHSEPVITGGIFLGDFPSSSTVGNPYLGVELRASSDVFVELGARAPLTADDEDRATLIGTSADGSRRLAFSQEGTFFYFPLAYDAVTAQTLFNIRHVTPEGLLTRIRLGPAIVVPTEDGPDTEVYALYALQMGYEGRVVRAGGAFSGWSLVSADQGNLGQRTATQVELHADFGPWLVRPGVDLKMPIGSRAGLVPVVLGISVGASF
jgi:hypothetical protein